VLVAGEIGKPDEETNKEQAARYGLTAIDLEKGTPLWTTSLPAAPAAWGIAVSNQGRILITLANGQVLGF
jgi:outer membrane protein assembly factor BamB